VKFRVVPKASETFGYQTLDGWPRTDGGWEGQEQQVLQEALRPLHGPNMKCKGRLGEKGFRVRVDDAPQEQ
jgi:hypothetical protein